MFEKEDRKGYTKEPFSIFEESYEIVYKEEKKYGGPKNHPTYLELKKYYIKKLFNTSINFNEETYLHEQRLKKCDNVFADYLGFILDNSKIEYSKKVMIFCLLYRECLNDNATKFEINNEKLLLFKSNTGPRLLNNYEYCLENNAEQIPDISNDFIKECKLKMEIYKGFITLKEIIELTLHFCNWVFYNGYSCSLISDINIEH